MRILVITDGLEPLLRLTVVGLADRGHHVRVVGALSPGELDPEDRFRLGDTIEVIGGEPGGPARRVARFTGRLARSARADPAALRVVTTRIRHLHGVGTQFADRVAAYVPALAEPTDVVYFEAANVAAQYAPILDQLGPKLVMCTGSDVRILPDSTPWLARALPAVFATMTHVVCRSQDLQQWAVRRGASPERTSVLYPAVDTRYFSASPRPPRVGDVLRLVSIGRMHWVKGYEHAIEAVARARATGADVSYTIVGADRGAGEAVEYAIRDCGVSDLVTLAGERSVAGVRAALARADVFVLPSVGEGASRAALEAMAMGLPVITTDAGGMPEVVDDGVEGFVVPRRDPPRWRPRSNGLLGSPISDGR